MEKNYLIQVLSEALQNTVNFVNFVNIFHPLDLGNMNVMSWKKLADSQVT